MKINDLLENPHVGKFFCAKLKDGESHSGVVMKSFKNNNIGEGIQYCPEADKLITINPEDIEEINFYSPIPTKDEVVLQDVEELIKKSIIEILEGNLNSQKIKSSRDISNVINLKVRQIEKIDKWKNHWIFIAKVDYDIIDENGHLKNVRESILTGNITIDFFKNLDNSKERQNKYLLKTAELHIAEI